MLDLVDRWRRPPMAVPWGFRACDYPLGSTRDRRTQERLRRHAEILRRMRAAERAMQAVALGYVGMGVSARRAAQQLSRALAAWGTSVGQAIDAALMPEAERHRRAREQRP